MMVLETCAHLRRSFSNQTILATAHCQRCLADGRVGYERCESLDLQLPM